MSLVNRIGQLTPKCLAGLLFLLSAAPLCAQSIPIRVESHQTLEDDLFGFRQRVEIDGTVTGDVSVVRSDVHLQGAIKGNLIVIGGSVMFYKNARVEGNVLCINGRLINKGNEHVVGNTNHYFDPDNRKPGLADSQKSAAGLFFGQSLILFLFVIGIFYIFPNQVHEASFQLSQDLVRSLIVGTVAITGFLIAIILSVVLMVVGIGYPLFLLVFLALVTVAGFGSVVVFYRLGQFFESITGSRMSLVFGILMAIFLAHILLFVPVVASLIVIGVLVFGTGVVMETRFGTNKQWFTKKSRYWSAG